MICITQNSAIIGVMGGRSLNRVWLHHRLSYSKEKITNASALNVWCFFCCCCFLECINLSHSVHLYVPRCWLASVSGSLPPAPMSLFSEGIQEKCSEEQEAASPVFWPEVGVSTFWFCCRTPLYKFKFPEKGQKRYRVHTCCVCIYPSLNKQ